MHRSVRLYLKFVHYREEGGEEETLVYESNVKLVCSKMCSHFGLSQIFLEASLLFT